jgi:hypothetical protein
MKESSIELSKSYTESINDPLINAIATFKGCADLKSPVLTARLLLDGFIRTDKLELVDNVDLFDIEKTTISSLVKKTDILKSGRLATEVLESCFLDNDYGPTIDLIKNLIGFEYELKLEEILNNLGISYTKENELREKGYDKTPDFKLDIPISLKDGTLISWIDSKATFGDEHSHRENYESQLKYYLNRFGAGLVIYWFGYLEDIKNLYFNFSLTNSMSKTNLNKQSLSILIADSFPSQFAKLDLDEEM